MDPYSETSDLVDISRFDTHGLGANYKLRRHKFEHLADTGCHKARSDWVKYIGPLTEFGGCNHINGNFSAVVLPLCRPDRLELIAYVLECKSKKAIGRVLTLTIKSHFFMIPFLSQKTRLRYVMADLAA